MRIQFYVLCLKAKPNNLTIFSFITNIRLTLKNHNINKRTDQPKANQGSRIYSIVQSNQGSL